MTSPRRTVWLRLSILVGLAIAIWGGYGLLRYKVWPAYRTWSIARMNGMARNFIAADDPRNALLTVRKVLAQRPNNAEAWRLGAKAADMRSSVEAVMFQRNLCRVDKSPANHIELIRLALKHEVYAVALESIQAVSVEAKNMPEFHRLAAETYRKIRRGQSAKDHLISLLALTPKDLSASLMLAEVEFEMDPLRLPADWQARVAKLADDPSLALPASLLQLRAAVARRSAPEAGELAVQLLARTDLDLTARLYLVEAAYLYDPSAADRMLSTMQNQATLTPGEVIKIMDFLLLKSQYAAIKAWYPRLPEPTRQDVEIKLSTAQAMRLLRDWDGMEKLLRGARWSKEEPLRLGLLAYAYRNESRISDFSETWKLAVSATGRDAREVMALLHWTEEWRWDGERYDLLWKLFNLMPTVDGVREPLIAHEFRNGSTVNLNKIYARANEANPADENIQNNFAYTSLLLGTNENRALQIARELHLKHPENVAYLTTYTFGLYKQGAPRDALDLVEKLGASERATSAVRLQEAVYSAAMDQTDRAARLLAGLAISGLLPEERRLVEGARVAGLRDEKTGGRQSAMARVDDSVTSGDGWLSVLPPRSSTWPTELKVADTYYREKNYLVLRELLQRARWANDEYLRQALLAFVERQQAHESVAGDYWRQAFAGAGRDLRRLRDLESLAAHWDWSAERMGLVDRIFETDATTLTLPEALLDYYRQKARTPDLARLYWRYVERTDATGPEAAWCVYYSLLCGMNVSSAHTLAERIHRTAPQDNRCNMAYAFSLWFQQRPIEAWSFLQNMDESASDGMQAQLVAAGVLIDLGRRDDARARLVTFKKTRALPEEIALAETLSRKIGLGSAPIASTTK